VKPYLRVYSRTLVTGVLMTIYSAATLLWGTSTLAACIVAATVIIAQYGSDTWREQARK
jgi:hypothetical protein